MRVMILAVVAALFLVVPLYAVEVFPGPPPGDISWARGDSGSTWQHFDFPDGNLPAFPTDGDNPYGEPWAVPETGSWEWGNGWSCPPEMDPSGVVDGWHCTSPTGGKISIEIPNNDDQNEVKYIFMQITSAGVPTDIGVTGTGSSTPGYTVGIWPPGTVPPHQAWPGSSQFGKPWYTYFYGYVIRPNPKSETITIEVTQCTIIDQIVIDTLCTEDFSPVESETWSVIKALYR